MPTETLEDSVATMLRSHPVHSLPKTDPTLTPTFLDSISENEPRESRMFTWFVRIVVGTSLVMAAIVASWLTVSSIQAFLHH